MVQGRRKVIRMRGQKKGWSRIHPLVTLSLSRGVDKRSTEEEYFASNNAKNGEWGGNDPPRPLVLTDPVVLAHPNVA